MNCNKILQLNRKEKIKMAREKIEIYDEIIKVGKGPFGMMAGEDGVPQEENTYYDLSSGNYEIGPQLEKESKRIKKDRFKKELEYQIKICEKSISHFSSFQLHREPLAMHGFDARRDVGNHEAKIKGLKNTIELLNNILEKVYNKVK